MIIVVNSIFGEKLRALRMKKRISQKTLAQHCGISIYRLRRMEQGFIVDIEDVLMQRLCLGLDTTIEKLIYPDLP